MNVVEDGVASCHNEKQIILVLSKNVELCSKPKHWPNFWHQLNPFKLVVLCGIRIKSIHTWRESERERISIWLCVVMPSYKHNRSTGRYARMRSLWWMCILAFVKLELRCVVCHMGCWLLSPFIIGGEKNQSHIKTQPNQSKHMNYTHVRTNSIS